MFPFSTLSSAVSDGRLVRRADVRPFWVSCHLTSRRFGGSWHQLGYDRLAQFRAAEFQKFARCCLGRVEGVLNFAGFVATEAFFAAKVGCDGGICQAGDEGAAVACCPEGLLQVGLRIKAQVEQFLGIGRGG